MHYTLRTGSLHYHFFRWQVAFLLAGLTAQAQAPAWQSAVVSIGHSCSVNATAIGPGGDVYLVGSVAGTTKFGKIPINAERLDAFVAKWSPTTQQFVWAKRIGGSEFDEAQAVVVQGAAVYVAGSFNSLRAKFGTLVLANTDTAAARYRTGNQTRDAFIAKLTDTGTNATFTWVQRAGGLQDDSGEALAVSGPNVYLTGICSSPASQFGTYSLQDTSRPANEESYRKQYVAKLTDAGRTSRFDWVMQTGGREEAGYARSVAVQDSSVYVAGSPYNDDDWEHYNPSTTEMPYLTKLIDAGTSARPVWTQHLAGNTTLNAVAVSGTNLYLAGSFRDTLRLGTTVLMRKKSRSHQGGDVVFVAKLNDVGASANWTWVQQSGGQTRGSISSIALRGTCIYLTGIFRETIQFGKTTLASPTSSKLFLTRLTDAGMTGLYNWAVAAGPPSTYVPPPGKLQPFRLKATPMLVNTVVVSGRRVYIAGAFNGALQFGTRVLTFANEYKRMAFLASLTDTIP